MTSKFLLILGIGHVLGNFYFQTDKISEEKDKSFKGVIIHAIEYTLSVFLVMLPFINMGLIKWGLLYSVSHFAIDAIKYKLLKDEKIKKTAKLFIIDQCFHIVCIFAFTYIMQIFTCELSHFAIIDNIQQTFGFSKETVARWVLAILIIHNPANFLIQNILNEIKHDDTTSADIKAGRKIGSIERLIMLLFIAMDQYTAMGMVLTAKSIARYDQITKEQVSAEYYLIGTLLSTACVVVCKVVLL